MSRPLMNRLPRGCRTVGGAKARAMERCRRAFMSRFASFGYDPFLPSGLQLIQSAWERLPEGIKDRTVCLTSPFGEPCCLRADLTLAAVAYLSAHHAPQERPLRLCYAERVYRSSGPPESDLESTQIGAELLGWDGEGADAEVLFLLLDFLRSLVIDATVVLGDTNLLRRAFQGVSADRAQNLTAALQQGNLADYGTLIRGLPSLEPSVAELPFLRGGREVLCRGAELFGDDALATLRRLADNLEELGLGDRIRFDLSLGRELDYYSGPLFDVYGGPSGRALGGGGRYDSLLADFGILGQALGFGLDLERVAQAADEGEERPERALGWAANLRPSEALARALAYADRGLDVELSWLSSEEDSLRLARLKDFSLWVDLSIGQVRDPKTGEVLTSLPSRGGER